jgi:hypothetical protein
MVQQDRCSNRASLVNQDKCTETALHEKRITELSPRRVDRRAGQQRHLQPGAIAGNLPQPPDSAIVIFSS